MSEYTSANLTILEGLEPVRRRPGMYIGDIQDGSGLHHMIFEILGNAIDEHLAGRAAEVHLRIVGEEVTIADDGGGFQCGNSKDAYLRDCVTRLHSSPTRDHHFPHVHVGASLHGCGMAVVNALSTEFEVETTHGGRRRRIRCIQGKLVDEHELGEGSRDGTIVRFRPDATIFSSVRWDIAQVQTRLRELASMNPALTFRLEHEGTEIIRAPRGLVDWVRQVAGETSVVRPLRLVGAHDDVCVEVALLWRKTGKPQVHGFVSQSAASEGTHIEGFWDGLCDAWAEKDLAARRASSAALREVLGGGLVAAIHVAMYEPRFGAPTRDRLSSPEGRRAVYAVMRRGLDHILGCRNHPATQLLRERTSVLDS